MEYFELKEAQLISPMSNQALYSTKKKTQHLCFLLFVHKNASKLENKILFVYLLMCVGYEGFHLLDSNVSDLVSRALPLLPL